MIHIVGGNALTASSGDVYAKSVKWTPQITKVTVHKFDLKCTLQFGDPQGPGNKPGIIFAGVNVVLAREPSAKKKATVDWGKLYLIQNVNYAWRRTPPLHPDPTGKLSHECAASNRTWQLDGTIPYQGIVKNCFNGSNIFDQGTGVPMDSPGVFLEEGKLAFEDVTADSKFRTYLIWDVAGWKHVLARVDWSWKGHASCSDATPSQCASRTLPKNWFLVKNSGVSPPPTVTIGLFAGTPAPVTGVSADPTLWGLCP